MQQGRVGGWAGRKGYRKFLAENQATWGEGRAAQEVTGLPASSGVAGVSTGAARCCGFMPLLSRARGPGDSPILPTAGDCVLSSDH